MTDEPIDSFAHLADQSSEAIEATLNDLRRRDATVLAATKLAGMSGMSELDMYKRLCVLLAREKQTYLDMAVRATETTMFHGSGDGR